MKRNIFMVLLFLAVALVTTVIVFTAPASAIDIGGTEWNTGSNGIITFDTQTGSNVTGTYTLDGGELTGILEGQLLKGWWREIGNEKACGEGNAWSGPLVFLFADDLMSFKGDWGYCDKGIDDLDPSNKTWVGTRLITTTTTVPVTSTTTTTTPGNSTTTTSCSPAYTACGGECCYDLYQVCCGNGNYCCGINEVCCGNICCEEDEECCDDTCCESFEVCSYFYGCVADDDIRACLSVRLYGKHSEEVELLRAFRDEVLSQSPVGQEIIELYYQWSPVIVKAMEEDEAFKEEVKGMVDGVLELIGDAE